MISSSEFGVIPTSLLNLLIFQSDELKEEVQLEDKSEAESPIPPRDAVKLQVHSQDTQASYSLNGLQPETKYKVRSALNAFGLKMLSVQVCVKSYNKWGWSIMSEIVVISTISVVGRSI